MYIISQRLLKINTFANLFTLRTYENRLAREKIFGSFAASQDRLMCQCIHAFQSNVKKFHMFVPVWQKALDNGGGLWYNIDNTAGMLSLVGISTQI